MVISSQHAYNMAFLLRIGYFGLKCLFLAQKALIVLKNGPLSKPAFFDRFLLNYKTYFAVNSIFWP
jgi:hypothetical protein